MPSNLSRRAQRARKTALATVDAPLRFEHACIESCRAITRCNSWRDRPDLRVVCGGLSGH
jgi:hypothetical protein